MNGNEPYYLGQVLKHIERTVNRGESDQWSTYDFEKLSDAIYERTQVRLSVTTLKRIFGRLKYDSAPTGSTLNTLAQFAGYADWQDFKLQADRSVEQPVSPAANTVAPAQPRRSKRLILGLAGLVVSAAGVLVLFLAATKKHTIYRSEQFDFSADRITTEGVPNSVIFHYAARSKPDSLFIVQSWDLSRRTLVSADQHEYSAIYYYPGFFKAKLIADSQIVKTHDLLIASGGWLCLLEKAPAPVYFKKEEYLQNGMVEVNETMLAPYRASLATDRVRIFNVRDMGEMKNDNFTFETMVKNSFDDGANACHFARVLIDCKDDIIIIPLAAKTCVGDLSLYFCGWQAESKSADLSGFGCDLTQWTSLRVETVNKTATIYVNNKKVYTLTFPHEPKGIVGVQYQFNGAAAVKETRFAAGGKVYEMK